MTGKERFNAIIDHKKPDKMPLFIPTVSCTVASEILGRPALGGTESLHFKEEKARFYGKDALDDFEGRYYEDVVAIYSALRVDIIRQGWRKNETPTKILDENTLLFGDENGEYTIKRFFPKTQSYGVVKSTYAPLTAEKVIENLEEQLNNPPQKASKEEVMNNFESSGSKRIFDMMRSDNLGEIIPGFNMGIVFYSPAWLEAMYLETDLVASYVMQNAEYAKSSMEHLADAGYRWYNGGGDLASNAKPLFSPELCEAVLTKAIKFYSDSCRRKNVVNCYATDGNI